jgi:hypothetical protein
VLHGGDGIEVERICHRNKQPPALVPKRERRVLRCHRSGKSSDRARLRHLIGERQIGDACIRAKRADERVLIQVAELDQRAPDLIAGRRMHLQALLQLLRRQESGLD